MKLYEAKFDEFNISDITQKAINKKGIGKVNFINVKVNEKDMWCELLFEVESSEGNPIHTDMVGRFRNGLHYGYACNLRFIKVTPEQMELLKQGKGLQDVIDHNDVILHCDDPSFYWQGNHEEDDRKNNARYKFLGKKGSGVWSARHQAGGRKDGLALCKHLFGVRHWLEDSGNVGTIEQALRDLNLPLKSDQAEEKRDEEEKKDDEKERQDVDKPEDNAEQNTSTPKDVQEEVHEAVYKLYKYLKD